MREIFLSIVLIVVVCVAAAYGLQAMDWSAQSQFTSGQGNVRLN